MLEVLYTTSDLPLGKAISFFSKREGQKPEEVPSHMSFLFFRKVILEAKGHGVQLTYLDSFLEHNTVIRKYAYLSIDTPQKEGAMFRFLCEKYHGKKYDFLGVAWFLLRLFIFKICGKLLKTNKWEKSNRFFCNELLEGLTNEEYSNMSPNDQMFYLESHEDFRRTK